MALGYCYSFLPKSKTTETATNKRQSEQQNKLIENRGKTKTKTSTENKQVNKISVYIIGWL